MTLYLTRYPLPSGLAATTSCYARDHEHLAETLTVRGMGETATYDDWRTGLFEPPKLASELIRDGQVAAANHALIWISMIAVRADPATAWEVLNDEGLVHQLAHALHSAERGDPFRDHLGMGRLGDKLDAFERRIPGVHPSWGGEQVGEVGMAAPASHDDQLAAIQMAAKAFDSNTTTLTLAHQKVLLDHYLQQSMARALTRGLEPSAAYQLVFEADRKSTSMRRMLDALPIMRGLANVISDAF